MAHVEHWGTIKGPLGREEVFWGCLEVSSRGLLVRRVLVSTMGVVDDSRYTPASMGLLSSFDTRAIGRLLRFTSVHSVVRIRLFGQHAHCSGNVGLFSLIGIRQLQRLTGIFQGFSILVVRCKVRPDRIRPAIFPYRGTFRASLHVFFVIRRVGRTSFWGIIFFARNFRPLFRVDERFTCFLSIGKDVRSYHSGDRRGLLWGVGRVS